MTAASISKIGIRSWRWYAALSLLALWMAAAPPAAQAQFGVRDRILDPVDNSRFSVAGGNLHPAARPEFDMGALAPATKLAGVTMFFSRTTEQEAALQQLLGELQDRSSANYHRWLSPEEFADRFGLSQIDVDKIVAWLQSQGLAVQGVSRSRSWVTFSGSAQQVQAALRTDLHLYNVGGETHFAMSREPSLPSAFAGVVLGFRGLDDFRLKPHAVKQVQPRLTSGVSSSHFLAPGDLATIYNLAPLYSANINGNGQKLAVAGQTAINVSDVDTFRSLSGLPVNHPIPMLVPGVADPGIVAGDIDEANLDLDWAGAAAPNATILYVYANPNIGNRVIDAMIYVIDQNLAPILSISYGLCEGGTAGITQSSASTLASIAQQGNAQGITIVAPAGDNGAADCDTNLPTQQGLSVDLPGALPYVTSVGGTRFSGDASDPPVSSGYWNNNLPYDPTHSAQTAGTATMYIPETSWNDTSTAGELAATGGGSSIYFPKPSWQTGTGVPKDGARDVPDVSFNASANHDGYLACSEDNSSGTSKPTCANGFRLNAPTPKCPTADCFTVFGGTSAGVPIFAGIVALLNQVGNTPSGQGNVNPRLYALAAASPSSFHDITTGNNAVPFKPANLPNCTATGTASLGYSAGAGYDLATGLGSINAQSFVTTWTSIAAPAAGANITADFQLALAPNTMTVKRGACGTVQLTLTRPNGFAGTPAFSCSAAAPITAVTCSVSPVASGSLVIPESFPVFPWWPLAVLIFAAGLWFELAYRTQRLRIRAPGFALACLLTMMIGCGGGGGGSSSSSTSTGSSASNAPPTSTYVLTVDAPASAATGAGTVTVTGISGGVTHTVPLTVTVN